MVELQTYDGCNVEERNLSPDKLTVGTEAVSRSYRMTDV